MRHWLLTPPAADHLQQHDAEAVHIRLRSHSGAMYPLGPLMWVTVVCTCWLPSSLEIPKSVILGTPRSSSRMLSGLMSQWMIGALQPSWRYSSPRAMARAASARQRHEGRLSGLKRTLRSDPPSMN
uniref:Uncharacterized protein n=1 Tax=Triticum urartu TaxID=4572 RepID=A0A8R7VEH7_TRIUA